MIRVCIPAQPCFVKLQQQCMDRLTNFILADAVETASPAAAIRTADSCDAVDNADQTLSSAQGAQRHLGMVMIPGKHLVSVQRLGGLRGHRALS